MAARRSAYRLEENKYHTHLRKGNKEDSGNNRLVSLMQIPGKVVEQLILEIIFVHIKDKKIIRSSQHAITKEKS